MGVVLDYTSRIPPATLRASNVEGVCRYLSPLIQKTAWKRITLAEYRELTASGIAVTLNWEYDARDWLGGASAGAAHATQAVAQARSLGYPAGSVIVGSCDFDITRTQYVQSARNYAAAFASHIREGGYRPGVYGPWDVLTWVRDDGLMDAFWQAGMSTAWSQGRNKSAWPGAHIRQRRHMTVGGVDTDVNDILIRPLWGVSTVDLEAGMPFVAKDGNTGQYYVCDLITSRPVPTDHVADVLYLAEQLGYPHRPQGNNVEWTDNGWTRLGWSEAAFGALPSTVEAPSAADVAREIIAQLLKGAQK